MNLLYPDLLDTRDRRDVAHTPDIPFPPPYLSIFALSVWVDELGKLATNPVRAWAYGPIIAYLSQVV